MQNILRYQETKQNAAMEEHHSQLVLNLLCKDVLTDAWLNHKQIVEVSSTVVKTPISNVLCGQETATQNKLEIQPSTLDKIYCPFLSILPLVALSFMFV